MTKGELKIVLKLKPGYLKKSPTYVAATFGISENEAREALQDVRKEIKSAIKGAGNLVKREEVPMEEIKLPTIIDKINIGAVKKANNLFNLLVLSDLHSVFIDHKAWQCTLAMIKDNKFDEIVLNGDVLDFPFLSRFDKKLFDIPILNNYSEIFEIEFAKEFILKPLREVAGDTPIIYRLGNHEERLTEGKYSQTADRIAKLFKYYNTSELNQMLDLDKLNIIYDPSKCRNYFDNFDIVHGLSLAKTAPRNNIQLYMSSGTSGDSHRLNSTYIKNKKNNYVWVESGCLRTLDDVEYLRTANIADWMQGFVTVVFDKDSEYFYVKTHPIVYGSCEFNGIVYK